MFLWIAVIILALLIILDLARKVRLIGPVFLAVYLPLAVNAPLVISFLVSDRFVSWTGAITGAVTGTGTGTGTVTHTGAGTIAALTLIGIEFFYIWIHLNVFPVRDGVKAGFRLKALIGATPLLYSHIYIILVQLILLPATFVRLRDADFSEAILYINIAYSLGCCLVLFLNGILRAFIASRRLGILRRVLILLTLWVPVVNWVICWTTARLIRQEYQFGTERLLWEQTFIEDDTCKTRYPVLMLHGLAFRDLRFFSYWGRIPRYLKRFGADLHYGNQEALGTVEQNGIDIKARIEAILQETGAGKVNIIAHSKGGLDARYAVSVLGIGDKVASLTTMGVPHHGCRFADNVTEKIPEHIYRRIARIFDATFRKYGDAHPDFYNATRQFRTDSCLKFNEHCPDVPGVYYQSYASVMQKGSSDLLLSIPFRYIQKLGEENDGLVSVESARWGTFRDVFRNTYKRGISHADLIDMKHEDFKGFDIMGVYVGIVSELKAMGY
ncbi:MAG: triacylglycerol lipase [Clostridiales Family XIII bacterium]|nr:triacylglycerol lipase [Clostridiales Family XIII bacterium]